MYKLANDCLSAFSRAACRSTTAGIEEDDILLNVPDWKVVTKSALGRDMLPQPLLLIGPVVQTAPDVETIAGKVKCATSEVRSRMSSGNNISATGKSAGGAFPSQVSGGLSRDGRP